MQGILVVAHGSRVVETEETLVSLLNIVREKMPDCRIEHAFMEFSERTLEKGIAALVSQNVTEIKVVPYFLFMGVHLREDIPTMIRECMASHPEINVTMGAPLGDDPRLADILIDRIKN